MTLKAYPSYKPSGIIWLGEIPEHWKILTLKRICRLAYGDSLSEDERRDGDFVVYGSNGPVGIHDRSNAMGPCLVVGRKGSFGKVNYSPNHIFAIDTTFFIDSRHTTANFRWLYYVLTWLQLDSISKDSAIPGLGREDAYAFSVPRCSLEEQIGIASFLDRETAKIDALIAKKERLIELLQEKRTALIAQAVTKGLDPNVPMKDSGVEWLGKIPAHWRTERNRRLFRESYVRSEFGQEELLTVSHLTGVTRHSEKNVTMIEAESHEGYKICRSRELVINTMWAWMGALGVAWQEGMVSPSYNVYALSCGILDPRYYELLCRVPVHISELTKFSKGVWKSRLRLYPEEFYEISTPLPPLVEQKQIADFISGKVGEIAVLIQKNQAAIDRLKEYRAALISAAVTGKIDFRSEAS